MMNAAAVMIRGRASSELDPVRDVAFRESMGRSMLGDWGEAVRLMGQYVSANPSAVVGYRAAIAENSVPWYHRDLARQPEFRDLVGAN